MEVVVRVLICLAVLWVMTLLVASVVFLVIVVTRGQARHTTSDTAAAGGLPSPLTGGRSPDRGGGSVTAALAERIRATRRGPERQAQRVVGPLERGSQLRQQPLQAALEQRRRRRERAFEKALDAFPDLAAEDGWEHATSA